MHAAHWQMASWPDVIRIDGCGNIFTTSNQDDIMWGRMAIQQQSFIESQGYLLQDIEDAIAIAWEYHKPGLIITSSYNPQ